MVLCGSPILPPRRVSSLCRRLCSNRWTVSNRGNLTMRTRSTLQILLPALVLVSFLGGQPPSKSESPANTGFTLYVGDSFSQKFTCVNCGTTQISWEIGLGTGALPAGLTLDSTTGVISGIPTTVQFASIRLGAFVNNQAIAFGSYSFNVY